MDGVEELASSLTSMSLTHFAASQHSQLSLLSLATGNNNSSSSLSTHAKRSFSKIAADISRNMPMSSDTDIAGNNKDDDYGRHRNSLSSSLMSTLTLPEVDVNGEDTDGDAGCVGYPLHGFGVKSEFVREEHGDDAPEFPRERQDSLMMSTEEKNLSFSSNLFDSPLLVKSTVKTSLMSSGLNAFSLEKEELTVSQQKVDSALLTSPNCFHSDLESSFACAISPKMKCTEPPQQQQTPNQGFFSRKESTTTTTTSQGVFQNLRRLGQRAPLIPSSTKRTKDEAKEFGLLHQHDRFRQQQLNELNSASSISMAASLENAPLLKLRRRAIEKRTDFSTNNARIATIRPRPHLPADNRIIFNMKQEHKLEERHFRSPAGRTGWIGAFSPKSRKLLIQNYLEKRKRRKWSKRIRYTVRKTFADSRLRVKDVLLVKKMNLH